MTLFEKFIYWIFPSDEEENDDTPDSRSLPYKPSFTGMEIDSGEDILKNG